MSSSEDTLDRIGQQKLTGTLSTYPLVTRQPADQSSRNGVVTRQFVSDLLRQIFQRERQRAETIEANYTLIAVNRNEHTGNISLLILACPKAEPLIEIGLTTREPCPVMMPAERFDQEAQGGSSHCGAVAPQRRNELFSRFGRIQDGLEESISVRSYEHHPFMLLENPAGSLIGEITSRQTRDSHRALNEFLGRGGDAQLKTFSLELTIDCLFAAR
jgi:hypothetical protein